MSLATYNAWANRVLIPSWHMWTAIAPMIQPESSPVSTVANIPTINFPRPNLNDRRLVERTCPPEMSIQDWLATLTRVFWPTMHPVEGTPLSLDYQGKPEAPVMQTWVLSGFVQHGVKLYVPTAAEWTALSQVELRMPFGEYRQPFETMGVVMPPDLFAGWADRECGQPVLTIIRFNQDQKLISTITPCTKGKEFDARYSWNDPATVIEDRLKWVESQQACGDMFSNLNNSETEVADMARRVALNACLLLANTGVNHLGPSNPEYFAKLGKAMGKKKLPENIRAVNRKAMAVMPQLYGFNQNVKVYEVDDGHDGGGHRDSDGNLVRPHWRRGHWANQPHGERGSLRKRIFRAAVMVNAKYLTAPMEAMNSTYKTAAGVVGKQAQASQPAVPTGGKA